MSIVKLNEILVGANDCMEKTRLSVEMQAATIADIAEWAKLQMMSLCALTQYAKVLDMEEDWITEIENTAQVMTRGIKSMDNLLQNPNCGNATQIMIDEILLLMEDNHEITKQIIEKYKNVLMEGR